MMSRLTCQLDPPISTLSSIQYIGQGFHKVWYQDIVKATVSGVLEDLTFKISEGSDQN